MSEFDDHSLDYEGKLTESLGPLSVTAAATHFAEDKVARIAAHSNRRQKGCFLDFGAGVGIALPFIAEYFPEMRVIAADTSSKSLDVINDNSLPAAATLHLSSDRITVDERSIDIAMAACVFHHIQPERRLHWLMELYRSVRPGGSLWIFEHNPLNPITQWIVRNSPLDENALLLSPREVSMLAEQAGFKVRQRRYTLIGPPSWYWLRPVERVLSTLPLGAQYFVELQR